MGKCGPNVNFLQFSIYTRGRDRGTVSTSRVTYSKTVKLDFREISNGQTD